MERLLPDPGQRRGVRHRLVAVLLIAAPDHQAPLALRTTRPLLHEAVTLIAAGQDARTEVGLAKVAARMLQQVTDSPPDALSPVRGGLRPGGSGSPRPGTNTPRPGAPTHATA